MDCLMIDCGAPARETAMQDGEQRWPRMRARTQAPVYSRLDAVGGAAFEALGENGDRRVGG